MQIFTTRLMERLQALYGGERSYQGNAGDMAGRALGGNPIIATQTVDYVLTNLVLKSGPNVGVDVGISLFPVSNVGNWHIKIPKRGAYENVIPDDTERPWGAEILADPVTGDATTFDLRRYSWATKLDIAQLQNATTPWIDLGTAASSISRQKVLRSADKRKAAIVANNANFGTVSAGGDWRADGTMLDEINAAGELLTARTGVQMDQFSLALFNGAWNVARHDAGFLASRVYTAGAVSPSTEDVRAYLGVKEVLPISSMEQTDPNDPSTTRYLFPSDAVLYYKGDPNALALPELGGNFWGKTFRLPGVAITPFYIQQRTSWFYPFEMGEIVYINNANYAVKITAPQ